MARDAVSRTKDTQTANPILPELTYEPSQDELVLLQATSPALLELVKTDYRFITSMYPNLPLFFDVFGTDPIHWGVFVGPDTDKLGVDARGQCIYHDSTKGFTRIPTARQAFHETQHTVSVTLRFGTVGETDIFQLFPPEILIPLLRYETDMQRQVYEHAVSGIAAGFEQDNFYTRWDMSNTDHSINEFFRKLTQEVGEKLLKGGEVALEGESQEIFDLLFHYLEEKGISIRDVIAHSRTSVYGSILESKRPEAIRIGRIIDSFLHSSPIKEKFVNSPLLNERAQHLSSSLLEVSADVFNLIFPDLANKKPVLEVMAKLPEELKNYLCYYDRLLHFGVGMYPNLSPKATNAIMGRNYVMSFAEASQAYLSDYQRLLTETYQLLDSIEKLMLDGSLVQLIDGGIEQYSLFMSADIQSSLRGLQKLIDKSQRTTDESFKTRFMNLGEVSRACVLLTLVLSNVERAVRSKKDEKSSQMAIVLYFQLIPVIEKFIECELSISPQISSPNSSSTTDNRAELAYVNLGEIYREIMNYLEVINKELIINKSGVSPVWPYSCILWVRDLQEKPELYSLKKMPNR